MRSDWREFGEDPLPPSLRSALGVFVRHGYHGTSIRAIAEATGLSVAGLYHHYPSKQAILAAMVDTTMSEMIDHSRAALAAADGRPAARFDNVVEALIRFHMARRDHAFLASTEMRGMEPELRARHVAQRDLQQHMIEDAVLAGVDDGVFRCEHPREAARAISSLCVSIASWYRSDGHLTADEVVARYLTFARLMVGATG